MWVFYQVDPAAARPFLDGTGLELAVFDGFAISVIDFQRYTYHSSTSLEATTEVEFSLIAYPSSRRSEIPARMALRDFIAGKDQTKLIGHKRIHVPTDSEHAVQLGRDLFGEPKFHTTFTYRVPSRNDPTVHTWRYTCNDPQDQSYIFSVGAVVRALPPTVAHSAPLTEYSVLDGNLIGSHWNLLGIQQTFFPDRGARELVTLGFGHSPHPMRRNMETVLSLATPVAVQIFESAPTAIEGRGFYVTAAA